MEVNAEDYFTYDARLASFKTAHKRRGSTKGKAMKWPHAHLKADAVRTSQSPIHRLPSLPEFLFPPFSPTDTLNWWAGWRDGEKKS